MIESENDMSFSKETIGNVSTVVLVRHKFIIKDMQKKHWKRTNQMARFSL